MNHIVTPTKMVMSQCKTCRYSEGKAVSGGWVLFCNHHDRITYQACESYEREPGSDDE